MASGPTEVLCQVPQPLAGSLQGYAIILHLSTEERLVLEVLRSNCHVVCPVEYKKQYLFSCKHKFMFLGEDYLLFCRLSLVFDLYNP